MNLTANLAINLVVVVTTDFTILIIIIESIPLLLEVRRCIALVRTVKRLYRRMDLGALRHQIVFVHLTTVLLPFF